MADEEAEEQGAGKADNCTDAMNRVCTMPNAQCPMPNAPCPMPNIKVITVELLGNMKLRHS
ncbi:MULTISPECIES: histidine kinase [Calothrix]|uniref:Histidine kinase n=2 Tax=Calothrix TaxID=1186 RepID=A0ABR8AI20_9CYAN|nr:MULTISPECIES: histidine kinase [Calothrix]MBD2198202.1 histidine kinase [Calothrix parietina FACHB-288]MBD2226570.1 histidine kinase [Calothrix anomala FACHB-343]